MLAYLLDNEDDPDSCQDDYHQREEEPGSEQIYVVWIVLLVFPSWSTAHPIILNRVCPPPKKGRDGHDAAPDPRHDYQKYGDLSAVPKKPSLG